MRLRPCSVCARHVRDMDPTCPFCGAARTQVCARPFVPPRKRSAVFASALLLGACATTPGDDPSDSAVSDARVDDSESIDTTPGPGADTNADTNAVSDAPIDSFLDTTDTRDAIDTAIDFDARCDDAGDADTGALPACVSALDSYGPYVVCDTPCYHDCNCVTGGGPGALYYGRGHCACTPGACYGAPPPLA